jgi:hypothetical protein
MTTPGRFAYTDAAAGRTDGSRLAYLPITLRHATHVLAVVGLLDTGSTVNVLPYPLGLQLGLVWEQQMTQVQLTGSLARLPARRSASHPQVWYIGVSLFIQEYPGR